MMTAKEQTEIFIAYQSELDVIQVEDKETLAWTDIPRTGYIFNFVDNNYRIKPKGEEISEELKRAASMFSHQYMTSHNLEKCPRQPLVDSFVSGAKFVLNYPLKLYKVTPKKSGGYDSYQGIIVAATNDDEARDIHPSYSTERRSENVDRYLYSKSGWRDTSYEWASTPKQVDVQCIGYANDFLQKYDIICVDFYNG